MGSFDYIADDDVKPLTGDWVEKLTYAKKHVTNKEQLTKQRTEFITAHGIESSHRNQGAHKTLSVPATVDSFDLNTAKRSKEEALAGFPKYSARLLLDFSLVSPLLTRDDEPFYLIDNPARKDHIFGSPYLSAAAVKGLSFDAYQRAFPAKTDLKNLEHSERILAYRLQDESAKRLFGLADDGANDDATQIGQLHFSPVWFKKVQFIVLNPKDKQTSMGVVPIQMEAIAPQDGCVEVVYFSLQSNESQARQDLARFLASLSHWWTALGLGGKRLAGYGQIRPKKVTLQTVGWSNMPKEKQQVIQTQNKAVDIEKPAHYDRYLKEGILVAPEELDALIEQESLALDEKIAELDKNRRKVQGKEQRKANEAWEKAKKNKESQLNQLRNSYSKAKKYWDEVGHTQTQQADETAIKVDLPTWQIEEKAEMGINGWTQMAEWIAGGMNGQ